MLHGEAGVGERLGSSVPHALGRLLEPHLVQRAGHGPGLFHAGLGGFLGMNRLEHGRDLAPLGLRHLREHVAVEVDSAPLVGGVREHLGDGARHGGGLVAGEHPHAGEAAALEPREELPPALGRLGEALGGADHLAVAVVVDAYCHHDGHVLEGAAPASLQVDAVDEDVGVAAGERPAPPFLDRLERLVVEIGDGGGRHGRPPEDLGDVLDAPCGDAGKIHLDHGLLDGCLPALVSLDDSGGEPHSLELGHLERDLP